MPDFTYTARNLTGTKVEGSLSAGTHREALAQLATQDLFPLEVKSAEKNVVAPGAHRVKSKVMVTVYSQLASLLRSGVPLLRSVEVLRKQTSNVALKAVLGDIHDQVEEGSTLGEAMAKHPRAFSELAVSIVRAGSEGGFLEEALERVAKFTDQQDELKSRVMGALAYPIFLAVFGVTVINGLIIFVVPQFEGLFTTLRRKNQMPAITEWLLATSEFMQNYWWLVLAVLGITFAIARQKLSTPEGRLLIDRLRLKVPQAGTIYLHLAVSRFCRVLGTLLSGGVPIVRALEISADSTGNKILSASIQEAADNISAGESLAKPLGASGHFPSHVVEMIAVAEESNNLEPVLGQISDTLERETWRRLDLFVRLLEPLMLLVLTVVVLVVILALLIPVLRMSATIG